MGEYHSKIAGVSANNTDGSSRQKYIIKYCKPKQELVLKREPNNPYDKNAVSVWIKIKTLILFSSEAQIGYLNSDVAEDISSHIQSGGQVRASIKNVTGGTRGKKSYGVNIFLEKW